MGRIRTIKPEFPQSETMGRLSRDARLLFVQLWTIADDEGRARASSRMLASLLYPYDDDAHELMDGWLAELERENCIRRYEAEGATFLEVVNWLKHQKIDRPSKSRLPSFDEGSRIFDEGSATDLGPGPRTMDQDQGPDSALRAPPAPEVSKDTKSKRLRARTPLSDDWLLLDDDKSHAASLGFTPEQIAVMADAFANHHRAKGNLMANWSAAWRTWCGNEIKFNRSTGNGPGRPRPLQDDSKSVSRAAERIADGLRQGTIQIPPRPSLVSTEGQGNLRLLPKG